VLKDYEDTNIMFGGHTDSRGSESYNQDLSEQRARSVAEFMAFIDVDPERMTIVGYGEEKPVATNETVEGRQENRRVEVAIWANDELKEAAENGEIGS
jgi:outer membrane protein OmpA-like peptidoglycan-associated protein